MLKIIISFGLSVLLIIVFTSCSHFLKTSKTAKKPNGNNTVTVNNSSYDTSNVFKGSVVKNVGYNNAANYKGTEQRLLFDVYKPVNTTEKKFPAVILIHGGSFTGGDKNNLASTCSKLANNGYVAVSVNYRLGWGFISRTATTCDDTNHLKQAMYRAAQDVHTALRYIAKHADEYNIDKNWIFIGGQSAGAITALLTAYLKDKDIAAFFPDDYLQKFGPPDKDEDDTNASLNLKGIISMWGAFVNPELITSETALPTIFFQGEKDKAVPFYSKPFVPCDNSTILYGTSPLYNRLKVLCAL